MATPDPLDAPRPPRLVCHSNSDKSRGPYSYTEPPFRSHHSGTKPSESHIERCRKSNTPQLFWRAAEDKAAFSFPVSNKSLNVRRYCLIEDRLFRTASAKRVLCCCRSFAYAADLQVSL